MKEELVDKIDDKEKDVKAENLDNENEVRLVEDTEKLEQQNDGKEEKNDKQEEQINNKSDKEVENKKQEDKIKLDNENQKKGKHKKRSKKKIIISIIIIILMLLFFSTIFSLININNVKIATGVSIEGIAVSGLTKEEAKAKLETTYSEKMQKNIDIKYGEYETELNPTALEVKYDVDKAVEEAYSIGRDNNIFINNYMILFTMVGKKNIDVNMTLNEDVTKQTIENIESNLPGIMTEWGYSVEDNKLIITSGKEGIAIKTDELINIVKDRLNDINLNDDIIEIPVETKKPSEIDVDKIHNEIYKEVKDAYYTKDPFTVYPEVEGVDFDIAKAREIISAEEKEEYVIELTITKPNVTVNQIGTEAFPDQLATFSTRYDASDKDRTTNLTLACQKMNGKVLLPGETFSYNETLGPRTYSAGYRNAKVYENGQVVDGIGGGICQISSTLYNAALMSDMEIVERRNHQFVTSYVGAGRDATVVYGLTDFKFKNTRKYPVKIIASAKGGVATVSIFGIKEPDREYTYSFSTQTISTIPYTTKYVEDSSLAPGKEVVKQKGANGIITQTYMTKRLDGKVVSTELLSKDTYTAMQRIVYRGKSKTTSTTTTENKKENTTTTTQSNTQKEETSQNKVEENKTNETSQTQTNNPNTTTGNKN